MKILLAQNSLYVPAHGGANKANRALIERLAGRGHECCVVVPACGAHGPKTREHFHRELAVRGIAVRAATAEADVFDCAGVEVHAVARPAALREYLLRRIDEFIPAWCLVSSEDPSQVLLDAALEGCPGRVVYLAHTMLQLPFGPRAFTASQAGTALLRRATGIITVSDFMRDYIRRWGGLEAAVLPFPIYGPGPFPRYGTFDHGFVTIINPCAYKGIAIFAALARALPDVAFAAVPTWGTTSQDRADLERLANVTILPAHDDIDTILSRTRVLLAPSLWDEAFGLSVIEAMLRGIPVLASDVGGLPQAKLGVDYVLPVRPIERYAERFDEQLNPVPIVPAQDIGPWLGALRALLTDRGHYEQLGAASRDAALQLAARAGSAPIEEYLEAFAASQRNEQPPLQPVETKRNGTTTGQPGRREQISQLSPERRALLAMRLKQQAQPAARPPQIPPLPRGSDARFPLSFGQQRLWFLDQFEPNNPAYTTISAYRLAGTLERDALEHSINALVERHESLRTTFITLDGAPVQIIAPALRVPLREIDLRPTPPGERADQAQRLATAEAQQPFDLARGPLLRATLIRLAEDEHLLIFAIHHIVFDGVSAGIFLRELAALYAARTTGRPAALPELPIQYVDFAHWQRERLKGPLLEEQLAYWRGRLGGELPTLQLPIDQPRPPAQTYHGAHQRFALAPQIAAGLKALGQQEGATPFMLLLATFAALLARYSGQADIVIGAPVANRAQDEVTGLIGFFVNTLALRIDLAGNPRFDLLVQRARDVVLGAFAHQDVPFEKLVEELQPQRDLSRRPLTQVEFLLQPAGALALDLPGLAASPVGVTTRTALLDLTFALEETAAGFDGLAIYNTDLFDGATIERMIGHFERLLGAATVDPSLRVAELPLLSDQELRQLAAWNATQVAYPQQTTIHGMIADQATHTPDAIAVVFAADEGGEYTQLTYGALNARANQLAHALRARGVGPDALVGVLIERSPELVIALLAVLKAGGAYLPLDPAYPEERLAWMLADARPVALITTTDDRRPTTDSNDKVTRRQGDKVPESEKVVTVSPLHRVTLSGLEVVDLAHEWEVIAREAEDNPAVALAPDNLAYVIYTSGSTGRPKGAMNTHGAILNRLLWMQDAYGLAPDDRVLQKTPFSFDVSVWEFFWPLMTGAQLVVARPGGHQESDYLARTIQQQRITTLHFVPAMLHVFLDEPGVRDCASLRRVICSGEALPFELRERCLARLPGQLHNLYGPTEAAVDVTFWDCAPPYARALVPIGRPVANTQIYLLDRHLRPVPAGVAGELYIGGVQLARGYLGRPDLTAERFVPNPFARIEDGGWRIEDSSLDASEKPSSILYPLSSSRMYRTGDLARYGPDGAIEFLGRIDHQVKLRGNRIELGEIEAVLARHPAVRECVVIAREDVPGHVRLVAYLVPTTDSRDKVTRRQGDKVMDSEEGITVSPPHRVTVSGPSVVGGQWSVVGELRSFLAADLPEYMLPAAFVELERLPLSPNGKLERRALPAPDSVRPELEEHFVAPRSPGEEVLATVWAQVLGLERVGIHDNFFALGGDSILSIRVVARARQAGLQITPRQLFERQTIAELAAVAAVAPAAPADGEVGAGPVPLTPIQRWFFEQRLDEPQHWNQAVLLRAREWLDSARLEQALGHLLAHHDALRLRFVRDGAGWRQYYADFDGAAPFDRIDLAALTPAEQQTALETAAGALQAGLDLERGPLLRVALFVLGAVQGQRLLIAIHHLAVDGVSWRILLEDLATLYRQISHGAPAALPPRTTSFKRWAERLAGYARSDALREEAGYWLAPARTHVAPLPLDRPASAGRNDIASARSVTVALDPGETHALLKDAPVAYRARIDELLLAALALACAREFGMPALLLDLEGHGRADLFDEIDLSRTAGWFTAIYPVYLSLDTHVGAEGMLRAVKEQVRGVPNGGIGYGLLRYMGDDTLAGRLRDLPRAEMLFNYLGQFGEALPADGLFELANEPMGATRSPRAIRPHALEIDGMIASGRLRVGFTYSASLHERATIERLAARYLAELRGMIARCGEDAALAYTPTDFPLARLDQPALDRLIATGRAIEDIYPLSPMQQGLLFHTLFEPESGAYFGQMTCVLQGQIQLAHFQRAWQQVVERHAILRSAFVWEGLAQPLQVVRRAAQIPWTIADWRGLAPDEQRARQEAFLGADRRQGFQLGAAPLMRLALLRLEEDAYQFVWSHHHLLLDGWSVALVLDEVFACYAAGWRGETVRLAPIRPYRDYIAWLQRQPIAAAEAFWRQALRGFSAPTPIPVGRPAGVGAAARYIRQQIRFSEAETAALLALGRRLHVTLNTLVQGAWALLLNRYSGEEDIVFGATVAGRSNDLAGIETMVGLFINTLPVRISVAPAARVAGWLQHIQAVQAALRQFEHSPLAQVQGWSEMPRGQPLFESILVFDNHPADDARLQQRAGLRMHEGRALEQTTYPLTLVANPGAELVLMLISDQTRFEDATARRMLDHLRTLLDRMARQPDRPLAGLPMLTATEERQIVYDWNATARPYPRDRCIHDLFEEQAARAPDAVATLFEEQLEIASSQQSPISNLQSPFQVTYGELNRRANQLADRLRALGVRPGAFVAVYMDRSPEMLTALLGILKAGGAYVPLDITYPQARVQWILASLGVRWAVTLRAQLADLLEIQQQTPALSDIFCLDLAAGAGTAEGPRIHTRAQLGTLPGENLPALAGPEDLAYIIFTSGSTGTPKGVVVRHRPVINLIDWITRTFAIGPRDRVLFITSLCFDLSVYDIFGLLAAGGVVRVVAGTDVRDPQRLVDLLRREPITFWDSAPAALQQLAPIFPSVGACGTESLRLVFLSGDWIPVRLPDQVRDAFANARVIALGGATEATVWSNFYPVGVVEPHWASIPYGRPIQNAQYYVLDRQLNPCPIGVPGDLYIGGECLCDGYANEPALTAERFIPNPFTRIEDGGWRIEDSHPAASEMPLSSLKNRGLKIEDGIVDTDHERSSILYPLSSSRLYRTGDRARFWADGTIEFLGRLDHQVKIRGFRIELGEIEAALRAHPGVRECVVLAREDTPGQRRLVAYIISTTDDRRPMTEDRELKIEDSSADISRELSSILYPLSSTGSVVGGQWSVVAELRAFLKDRLPDYMIPVAFVVLETLPATANGKLDRKALPAPEQDRAERAGGFVAPLTEIEATLAGIWAAVLGLERVGVHDNFFEIGGDSILSIQITARAAQAGLVVSPRHVFEHQTIAALAAVVGSARPAFADEGPVSGPAPLLPIQRWFFEQDLPEPWHWNQAVLLEPRETLEHTRLAQAVEHLLEHHDALRLRYARAADGWCQEVAALGDPAPVTLIDLAGVPEQEQPAAIEAAAREMQAGLDLERAPLLRVALFARGSTRAQRLLIAIHHLAIDGVSWRILLEDLQSAYRQTGAGGPIALPPRTTSFKQWAERLVAHAGCADVRGEAGYWLRAGRAAPGPLPLDAPRAPGDNQEAHARSLVVTLEREETRALLHDIHAVYHTQISDVLLTALAQAFAPWTGARRLLVDLEGHGREDVFDGLDLSRTVGWFTSLYPALLGLPPGDDPGAALKAIKEQVRQIPGRGLGYGLLRYQAGDPDIVEQLRVRPRPELSFNYLGQLDQMFAADGLFGLAPEPIGPLHSPRGARPYLLEVTASVTGGQFQAVWTYSAATHRETTVAALAGRFVDAIRALIAHCRGTEAGGHTPSDFPLAQVNQQDLDKILARTSKAKGRVKKSVTQG